MIQTSRGLGSRGGTMEDMPDDTQGLPLTGRVRSLEGRVDRLEEESGRGREELNAGLVALTATVAALQSGGDGSLEHTVSRISTAEEQLVALQGTVEGQNTELRTSLTLFKTDIEALARSVGERSLLQTSSGQLPLALTQPTNSAGLSLAARITQLETRVAKLEDDAGKGRDDLGTSLEALKTTVENIRTGGVGSLQHVTERVESAEKLESSETATLEEQNGALKTDIAALRTQLDRLVQTVGTVALVEAGSRRQTPLAGFGVGVGTTVGLPLLTRIKNLETRVASLEEASLTGRDSLKSTLSALAETVGGIKAGGVSSLEHTSSRVGAVEQEHVSLEAAATQQHTDLQTEIATLRARLATLTQQIGS